MTPSRPLRTVFNNKAHLRQLIADFIGARPVASLLGFNAFGYELVDGSFIEIACGAFQEVLRLNLQDVEHSAEAL